MPRYIVSRKRRRLGWVEFAVVPALTIKEAIAKAIRYAMLPPKTECKTSKYIVTK